MLLGRVRRERRHRRAISPPTSNRSKNEEADHGHNLHNTLQPLKAASFIPFLNWGKP